LSIIPCEDIAKIAGERVAVGIDKVRSGDIVIDPGYDGVFGVVKLWREGEDKPLKYPDLIPTAKVLLINKIDLLPHLDFNLETCRSYAKRINPSLQVFAVSAKTGEGMADFYAWILAEWDKVASETRAPIKQG